jgi:class 3 adenylate cyclase
LSPRAGWRAYRSRRGPGGLDPLLLRFADPYTDREFRAHYDQAALAHSRRAAILAVALYASFAYLDTLEVSGDVSGLFIVRFAIVCPFITVLALLTYRPWVVRYLQLVICCAMVVAAFGLDVMPLVADVPIDYTRTGTLLILMFLFAFSRVRFLWATATTLVIVAGYEASAAWQGQQWQTVLYNNFFLLSFIVIGAATSYVLERLRREEFIRERALEQERARSDALLHNILPREIAARLRTNRATIAEGADDVSVLFADIVGFTPLSETLPPAQVVALLDTLFTRFDVLCRRRGIEKIKTIGDAYMAVAGVPRPDPDHAASIAELALDMQGVVAFLAPRWPGPLALRIGISSGPVVAGVIGQEKFAYDLWGDTVNTASRMESHGSAGQIQISATTHRLLKGRYVLGAPHQTTVKGKGPITTYFLRGRAGAPGTGALAPTRTRQIRL